MSESVCNDCPICETRRAQEACEHAWMAWEFDGPGWREPADLGSRLVRKIARKCLKCNKRESSVEAWSPKGSVMITRDGSFVEKPRR